MMNTMMIAATLVDALGRRLGRLPLRVVLAAFATTAPQALLAYAALSTGEPVLRAQLVVAGSERIVLALAAALAARAIYVLYVRPAGAGSANATDAAVPA